MRDEDILFYIELMVVTFLFVLDIVSIIGNRLLLSICHCVFILSNSNVDRYILTLNKQLYLMCL